MLYIVLFLVWIALVVAALFYFFKTSELRDQ